MLTAAMVLGQEDMSLNNGQAEFILLALLAGCVVGLVFVLRSIQKLSTRIILSVVLIAVGAGLWIQRENLQDCEGQCECRLFGRTLDIEDDDANCPD